jgi:hypothetical protein
MDTNDTTQKELEEKERSTPKRLFGKHRKYGKLKLKKRPKRVGFLSRKPMSR